MSNNLCLYFNYCNNSITKRSREESIRLIENYKLLMRFIIDLNHKQSILNFLSSNDKFLISVLNHFFCPSTVEFANYI